MSFKEVKELRNQGKLEEALQMAQEDLQNDPENIWNRRSIAWVYYTLMKNEAENNNFDNFTYSLDGLLELELPEDEKMVFDNVLRLITHWVYELLKAKDISYNKINLLFEKTKLLHPDKTKIPYHLAFKAFHKAYKKGHLEKYIEFADWWNFENFKAEDYKTSIFNNQEIMSLAEQAYIAYAKALLSDIKKYEEKIPSFIKKLDKLMKEYPKYKYPPYYKAQLLLKTGKKEKFIQTYISFIKKNKNLWWAWNLLAEAYDDPDKKIVCLSKAVLLNKSEKHLVKSRLKLAHLFREKKMYPEAKFEILKYIDTFRKENWRISSDVPWLFTEQEWYKNTKPKQNNKDLYLRYALLADELLYADKPLEIVAVEFVNQNKNMLNFVKDENTHGFFKYNKNIIQPQTGDILEVRLKKIGQDGFYKVLTIKKLPKDTPVKAIKEFKGAIHILPQGFGFVEDVFVPANLIEKRALENNNKIKGRAILSYNKRKKQWGWKALENIYFIDSLK